MVVAHHFSKCFQSVVLVLLSIVLISKGLMLTWRKFPDLDFVTCLHKLLQTIATFIHFSGANWSFISSYQWLLMIDWIGFSFALSFINIFVLDCFKYRHYDIHLSLKKFTSTFFLATS